MKQNCIAIPEALSGRLEAEGELEVSYKLIDEGGKQYLEVTGVEGEPVAAMEPQTPTQRLGKRVGYEEEKESNLMM